MGCKFSFKRLFLVASLSLAGLFGISAVAINEQAKEAPVMEEVKADSDLCPTETIGGTTYKIVWYYVASSWQEGVDFGGGSSGHCFEYKLNGRDYGPYYIEQNLGTTCRSEIRGPKVAKFYLPKESTHIRFSSGLSISYERERTAFEAIPTDGKNAFVLYSNHWNSPKQNVNQYGEWLNYSGDNSFTTKWLRPVYFTILSGWSYTGELTSFWFRFVQNVVSPESTTWSTESKNRFFQPKNADILDGKKGDGAAIKYIRALVPSHEYVVLNNLELQQEKNTYTNSKKTINIGYSDIPLENNPAFFINKTTSSRHDGYWGLYNESTNYYLFGDGSFVDGEEWTAEDGLNFQYSASNKGVLLNQYLEEGDLFKIVEFNSGTEYDWSDNDGATDVTHFAHTGFSSKDKSNYRVYINQGSIAWWFPSGGQAYIKFKDRFGNETSYSQMTKVDNDYIYFDVTNGADYTHMKIKDNTNESNDWWEVPDMITEDFYWLDSCGSNRDLYAHRDWSNRNVNIRVQATGYYDIYFNNSSNIYISPVTIDHNVGDAIYLDLNGNWDGITPRIHYWNGANGGDSDMTEVHNHGGSTRLFEWPITKVNDVTPTYVKFYYGSWSGQIDADLLLSGSLGCNTFKLTSSNHGIWSFNITKEIRASFYGDYFNNLTDGDSGGVCSPNGDTNLELLKSKWNLLKIEYDNMCTNAQGEVWKATGKDKEQEGTNLEKAMGRYDYIVFFRRYLLIDSSSEKTDFVGRSDSSGRRYSASVVSRGGLDSLISQGDYSLTTLIIIIASSVSLLSITALSVLLVKKRKQQ